MYGTYIGPTCDKEHPRVTQNHNSYTWQLSLNRMSNHNLGGGMIMAHQRQQRTRARYSITPYFEILCKI